ncbi:MAG: NUDIX hydrolase [Pseudomonadota bacterium]
MIKPWKVIKTKVEAQNRLFSLKTKLSQSPRTGREFPFYILEAGAWVNIIPLTVENRVLLVRQYRHGTEEITLEIPGGLVEDGQTPEEAAARELLEETGFKSRNGLILLGRVRPNPAFMNNWCYSYLARDVFRVNDGDPDEAEDLELVSVELSEIPGLIKSGAIDHSLVLSAFFHYYNSEGR